MTASASRADGDSRLLLGPAASDVRRQVGPTAWVVLEEIALEAAPDAAGRLVARTSTRQLATRLEMTPGTIGRALAKLTTCGLVRREDQRDVRTGRFGEVVYVLGPIPGLVPMSTPGVESPRTARPVKVKPCTKPQHAAGGPDLSHEGSGRRLLPRRAHDDQLALLSTDHSTDHPLP